MFITLLRNFYTASMAQSSSTETLMEEISRFECLYDKQNKEYQDKYKKVNAWIAVSSKFSRSEMRTEDWPKKLRPFRWVLEVIPHLH